MEDAVISPIYYAFLQGIRPEKELFKTWNRKRRILLKQWNKLSLEHGILVWNIQEYKQLVLPNEFHKLVYRELYVNLAYVRSEQVNSLERGFIGQN